MANLHFVSQRRFAREDKVKEYNMGEFDSLFPSPVPAPWHRRPCFSEQIARASPRCTETTSQEKERSRADKTTRNAAGAMTLLTYFHYCNKGKFPFSKACKETDLRELAELDEDMVAYIRQTKQHAAEHSKSRTRSYMHFSTRGAFLQSREQALSLPPMSLCRWNWREMDRHHGVLALC
jgi:hypothetical protein